MENLPEEISTGNEVLAQTGTSQSSQATPANQWEEAGEQEEPLTGRSNLPPRKKKNEALVLKHNRLRAIDVRQTEAVVAQRGSDLGDTVRKQYERGVHVDTALGAPGEDGLYGLYQGERLAELLRADIDGLISFALHHGVVPTLLAEYRRIIAGLNETIQSVRIHAGTFTPAPEAALFSNGQMMQTNQQTEAVQFTAVTEVADEADGVLGMFFGNSDSSNETVDTDYFPSE
ncbi:MAG TPA: hypothetical protein VGL94_20705 [Ktedonobacteraceae bacterium]|jgi:hypothetical protein